MKPDIESLFKKLKPIYREKIDRLWYAYLSADSPEEKQEIEQYVRILASKKLEEDYDPQTILLPPPDKNTEGDFFLANSLYNGDPKRPLFLRKEDILRQVGIFGITGSGKTVACHNILLQMLKAKIPFMAIDWKRSYRDLLTLKEEYPEVKGLKVFTAGRNTVPFDWNPLCPPPGVNQKTWNAIVAESLETSHLSGFGCADLLIEILDRLFKEKEMPNFRDAKTVLDEMPLRGRKMLWKDSLSRILNSLTYGPSAEFLNSRNPLRLEKLIKDNVILELDQEMPKPLRVFLNEILLRWVHLYWLNKGESSDLRHVIILEEVHNLFPKTRIQRETSSSLETIYRELRGFGVGIISITQHPSLLPVYLLGNSQTQIFLGLQHENDIRAAKQSLFLEYEEECYLNRLKIGEGIVKIKNRIDPCHVRFPFIQVDKGGISDQFLKGFMRDSYSRYSQGNQCAKENPRKNGVILPTDKPEKKLEFLEFVYNNPDSIVKTFTALNLSGKKGNRIKETLIHDGLLKQVEISMKRGRVKLLEVTPKGEKFLEQNNVKRKSRRKGGAVHEFWLGKVERYYQGIGYKTERDYAIGGGKTVDLVAEKNNLRLAIEIETGNSDFLQNIQKCAYRFSAVICVPTDEDVERKILRATEGMGIQNLKVVKAGDFA